VLLQDRYWRKQSDSREFLYIGCYAGKWDGSPLTRRSITKANPPINSKQIAVDFDLPPNEWPQVLIPHTFDAGEQSSFELSVHSSVPMKLEPISSTMVTPTNNAQPKGAYQAMPTAQRAVLIK